MVMTRREKTRVMKVIMVVCYVLAMISVGKYNLDMIGWAKCLQDVGVNIVVMICNYVLINIIEYR